MDRKRRSPEEDRDEDGEAAPEVPNPLEGWDGPGEKPGPESTLKPEMIPIIAQEIASGATKRAAAAEAGTTEDCLGAWLKRGREAAGKRKRSKYTRLLIAYERAEAHHQRFLRKLGLQSVTDRHCNPRFVTYSLAVRDPKNWTIPKEPAAARGQAVVGELLTPAQARAALEERLERFLKVDDERVKAEQDASDPPPPPSPEGCHV
ncbi:hypothetical protein [Hyalangium sp.]|uniref:hypothetical protein n=1 Tax=Hyalangium sp. TaxID=2028555 RepID=UPI002D422A05|nr:hypothetical protein [Hyalangium sp.]HYI01552.1 hypothetical protein [Hyalangium sp.]